MAWPTETSPTRAEEAPQEAEPSQLPLKGWPRLVMLAVYLLAFGIAARLVVDIEDREALLWSLGPLLLFFVLFSLVWLRRHLRPVLMHAILAVQCAAVLMLLAVNPEFDYVTALVVPLAYQAALVFPGRLRWAWIALLVVLTAGSLMVSLGAIRGLGLAMTTIAVAIVFPALALASRDIEAARAESRGRLHELEATHAQLEKYAADVHELSAIEERNRLARELHDSVSQAMFGILLATRGAQLMRQKDPDAVGAQLERLQGLTQEALARMRGFIAELRPKPE